jgi:hypothetical protein
MQRARHNGFLLEVYPEGVRWKYYIHDFAYPDLDCFGTVESADEAKEKAIKAARVQGAKVGRSPSLDPQVWVKTSGRESRVGIAEAVAVAGNR